MKAIRRAPTMPSSDFFPCFLWTTVAAEKSNLLSLPSEFIHCEVVARSDAGHSPNGLTPFLNPGTNSQLVMKQSQKIGGLPASKPQWPALHTMLRLGARTAVPEQT